MTPETPSTQVETIVMTIYSSQGKNGNPIPINKGILWEDVKKILRSNGYNIDTMRAVENIRKTTLENPKALIPDTNFNLHLYPKQSKGGAKKEKPTLRPRKELCETIKKHIAVFGDKAKDFFSDVKSYTNKTTEELDTLTTKWEKKHGTVTDVELPVKKKRATKHKETDTVSQEKKEAVSGLVAGLAERLESPKAEEHTPAMAIKTSISLLRGITGHENQSSIEQAITQLEKALILKPTPTEQELLAKEHEELGKLG